MAKDGDDCSRSQEEKQLGAFDLFPRRLNMLKSYYRSEYMLTDGPRTSPIITQDHLPERDFLDAGYCSKLRPEGIQIDTLVIHSCYVEQDIIAPKLDSPGDEKTFHSAEKLARQYAAEKALFNEQKISAEELKATEFAALHTLIVASSGEAALTTFSVKAIKDIFWFYGVSAHYIIDREGRISEFVPPTRLAFHAGKSKMPDPADGRESVNNFSIGIELLGSENSGFTELQYQSLRALISLLKSKFSIKHIVGHSDIAPGRKIDPIGFDWSRL